MTPQKLGSLIGAVFGVVFVVVNAGPLPTGIAAALRVLAVLAFAWVLVAARRPPRPSAATRPARGLGFGYWLVVAAEVIGFAVGVRLLNGPLDAPDGAVAWVALVVGLHFVALAIVWKENLFHRLGASIAASGAAGLGLGFAGSPKAAVATVGGVLPGALLLGFALWGVLRATTSVRSRAQVRTGEAVGGSE